MNPDLGNNARFLASVERIVDSLFNRRQESLSGIIEAKQVPVLREKFADGYVALFCRHRLGRDGAALWLFTCFVNVRHICVFFHFAGFTLVFMTEDQMSESGPIANGLNIRNSGTDELQAGMGSCRSSLRPRAE